MRAPRADALQRLASIEGHLRGIRKMIEEDAYCVDILKQTHAVKCAIDKLEDHLKKMAPLEKSQVELALRVFNPSGGVKK